VTVDPRPHCFNWPRVRRLLYSLVWAIALFSLALGEAGVARADGSRTSAGDQQYVDPLRTTSSVPASTAASPASSTVAPARPSAPRSSHEPSRSLPYTGLNVWLVVGAGVGLIGLGLALRRFTRGRT
jgi:hypothetical protein